MRIGIIGASGEIGTYVYEYLRNRHFEVLPLVRNSMGPILSRWDTKPLFVDLLDDNSIDCALRQCDVIVNCVIDKRNYSTTKERVEMNVRYCRNLLRIASRNNVLKIIHLSS